MDEACEWETELYDYIKDPSFPILHILTGLFTSYMSYNTYTSIMVHELHLLKYLEDRPLM